MADGEFVFARHSTRSSRLISVFKTENDEISKRVLILIANHGELFGEFLLSRSCENIDRETSFACRVSDEQRSFDFSLFFKAARIMIQISFIITDNLREHGKCLLLD